MCTLPYGQATAMRHTRRRTRASTNRKPFMTFRLESPAFRDGRRIPAKYTADGDNTSPPLEWSDPPPGTRSFALIVEDPDAPQGVFRHWGACNIDADQRRLPEGVGDRGRVGDVLMGINDFGSIRYDGPSPPRGDGAHRYHFKLAALDVERLAKAPNMEVADLWQAAEEHILGEAELVGTYER
jgi:Raf kinase inhibitor-like YbhB/YbcL family protein